MKVLFLLPIFKNTGPSNVVVSMIKKLLQHNVNLILISFYPVQDNYQDKFSSDTVRLIELTGFNFRSFRFLWRFIRDENVDVVHSHCLLPDIANPIISLFNKNKSVSSLHCNVKDNYRNEYSFPKGPVYYWLHRFSLMCIRRVICVSSSAQLSERSEIIYNGIGSRTLTPSSSNSINLIFAGRLIESKNIIFLLDSFDYLLEQRKEKSKTIQLHIFGDGELYSTIKQRNNEHVILHGFVTDYLSKLPQNSIVVNPSLFEGMPMAVVEALSCNIPVVLSAIDAHNEIAKHIHSGVALHSNSKESFYQAVQYLLNEKDDVVFDNDLMASQYEAEFSDTVMVKKYLKVYQS